MKKLIFFVAIFQTIIFNNNQLFAGKLTVTTVPKNDQKLQFKRLTLQEDVFGAWKESFDKVDGVIKSVSGYSGGNLKEPNL